MLQTMRFDQDAPWKQRFRAPAIMWTQLAAANKTRGIVASTRSGQIYAWDVPAGSLRQVTQHKGGLYYAYLSADGRTIYYHDDAQGNEMGHFVRVSFEGGAPEDITPELPPYAFFGMQGSRANNLLAIIAFNQEGFMLYCIDIGPDGTLSPARKIHQEPSMIRASYFSPGFVSADGALVALGSSSRSGNLNFSLLILDAHTGQPIGELWKEQQSFEPLAFSPLAGDERLLASSNETGMKRPFLWHPRTAERKELALSPLEGDVEPLDWSEDGRQILLCQSWQAVQNLYLYDLENATLSPLQVPGGSLGYHDSLGRKASFGPENEIFAEWTDATHPSQVIALSRTTGTRTRTVLPSAEVPVGRPWRSVSFPSSDGQMVQGWLAVPDRQGPYPVIIEMHGGMATLQRETFAPASQAWLDAGFAFLSVNFRGSSTFGRAFERKVWGDLGHWECEDVVAARKFLIKEGIATASQIFLTGASFGGYLTLLLIGKYPDLWAGGMAEAPVVGLETLYETTGGAMRSVQMSLLGGTPEEQPERYQASSAMTYIEQVRAPVLILAGRNDYRSPARPIELYEQKMKEQGKEIEVVWFDAGHISAALQPELGITYQEHLLRFAARVLGQPRP
ncbi:S9 family peptidase [Ktedonosporobacter rubrisoli]|uniref:Acyl-peptide hydrolase n=1 Tax=Ktedonosporobacter rubrisoli TaxID=2509675 RepID=A0A4P6JYL6_KTERU|nr:prolyl oligopeptidase family serine peptidase [Ktedonosporobacter rubrisoli]QBD80827.1 S9 family peptidase [Ktedonosporobacter rubrisoli]